MANGIARLLVVAILVFVSGMLVATRAKEPSCGTKPISHEQLNLAISGEVLPFEENVPATDRSEPTAEQREQAERLLGELVACSNAGEPLRVWSLYSEDYLARLFRIQGPFSETEYAAYAVPEPVAPGEGMRIEAIEDVFVRLDGVVGVEVVMTYPSVPMPKRLVFWMDGDPLRIEEVTGEISFSLP